MKYFIPLLVGMGLLMTSLPTMTLAANKPVVPAKVQQAAATPKPAAKVGCPNVSAGFRQNFPDLLGGAQGVCVSDIVKRLVMVILSIAGAVFFAMFLWGGILWMTAGGSADRTKSSTKTLLNAVIGMAIVITSYALTSFVIEKLQSGIQQ